MGGTNTGEGTVILTRTHTPIDRHTKQVLKPTDKEKNEL